jgi:hypothetical protein
MLQLLSTFERHWYAAGFSRHAYQQRTVALSLLELLIFFQLGCWCSHRTKTKRNTNDVKTENKKEAAYF